MVLPPLSILPPTKGISVRYTPAPDIKLNDFKLRVPSSAWDKGCHGQQISQWKSDPYIAAETAAEDIMEQWEIELVAKRINSQHCYLHLFLRVKQSDWENIKTKYGKFSQRMLQLLLTWQQQNGGQADRQQLVTALYSSHLDDLANQLVQHSIT